MTTTMLNPLGDMFFRVCFCTSVLKGEFEMGNEKYRIMIIILLLVSLIVNFYFYIENKELKENRGDEVSDISDIVLVLVPRDILEILNQEKNIQDEDFERIVGEFRVGIVFYWLSNGIPEIENYFRYMEEQFLDFKKAYQESQDKNSEEIKKIRKELIETCEKGLKLHDELNAYFDKYSDYYKVISSNSKENKKYRMWYQVYKNKEHEIRKCIIETLGENRTTYH